MTTLTDNELRAWATQIARKIDDFTCHECDHTFYASYGDFEAEIHRMAEYSEDFIPDYIPVMLVDKEEIEIVAVWGIKGDYPEDELHRIEEKLTWMLN